MAKTDKTSKKPENNISAPIKFNKEELQKELELRKEKLKHNAEDLSADLISLLADEIENYKKMDKRRSAEMLSIFAAHNYYANGFTPVEMRTTLEDLGPTYVKIGQIMSSRVDILPAEYCKELEKLRQNVKPLDSKIARAVIEQETGKKIDELYSEFRDEPLGSASIGQVHFAVLKDGRKVVTKVQRPLIAEMMRRDFVLLKKMADIANIVADDESIQTIDLFTAISELEKVTNEELDFRVEAENLRFFKEKCIDNEDLITCPDVIDELTTERIFTMTFVDGCSVGKKEKLLEQGCDLKELGRIITENYVHQILDVGTFHADPHQGNIMVSNGKPYWIDFGMIGRITDKDIDNIQTIVLALLKLDAESLVNTVLSMGASSPKTNRDKLLQDAEMMLNKYADVRGISDLDVSVLFDEVMELSTKHGITMPGQYTMLARSVLAFEGVIENLCPELNLFKILSDKLMERMLRNFDIKQELLKKGKEIIDLGQKTVKIPELTITALNNLVKGRTKMNMEITGLEEPMNEIKNITRYIILSLFACILFIGSCILCTTDFQPVLQNNVPLIAVCGIVFSISLAIFVVKNMWKK